ncbi:ABC transporter permease [Mesorhizobium sp. M8A.F.Ca.ET.023.01.1.1]|nr:ABC transporter permease [Mesorhizobium sp. M8A.F.Ca.ET.023.01.1.1]
MANNQAEWMASILGGKGKVFMDRGLAGAPISEQFEKNFGAVLKKYPGIEIVGYFNGNYAAGPEQEGVASLLAAHPEVDGIFSQGYGTGAIKALQNADRPLVPLIILLVILVVILQILRPGIVNERWIANTIKFAIPLAILAGCQTMTMLTGGIDLSVGTVATMSAFIMATQIVNQDPAVAFLLAMMPAVLIGLVNGIGVGVFRVHPLIMTLGTSLIGTGCLQVYQRTVIASGAKIPDFLAWLGTGVTYGFPNALLLFVPLAALIVFTLARTGFGRLLYAVGDNERATRLSGVQYWQVITALYVTSSVLAGITGLLYIGLIKAPSLSLAEPLVLPSVAAAVIGGTSIFGGRGGYTGTIIGALILTVLTTLLTILQMPEGARRILFGLIVLFVTAAYLRIVEER